MSYEILRQQALTHSAEMPDNHPCHRGNAKCCEERNIPVTPQDAELIERAAKDGTIAHETIKQAKKNAANKDRADCAFLGDNRECTIYEQRPLICIATGSGGLPQEQETWDYALREAQEGRDPGTLVKDTVTSMCDPCGVASVEAGVRYPFAAMVDMQEIYTHIGTDSQPMDKVVPSLRRGKGSLGKKK